MTTEKRVPVLYLDLDGTVRHGLDELGRFVNGPEDVVVFPEAIHQMLAWKERGGRIIGISNQGGIALGHVTMEKVAAAMAETHKQTGHLFDKIAWCQHHPQAKDPEYARCWCRKPAIGLLVETALQLAANVRTTGRQHEIYPPHLALFVGDRTEDALCAQAASIDFVWAKDWRDQ